MDHSNDQRCQPVVEILRTLSNIFSEWTDFMDIYKNRKDTQLECGPMPNVMVALLNIGGVLCSMPQSLADAH